MTWTGHTEPTDHTELGERAARLRRIARCLADDLARRPVSPVERTRVLLRIGDLRREADRLKNSAEAAH